MFSYSMALLGTPRSAWSVPGGRMKMSPASAFIQRIPAWTCPLPFFTYTSSMLLCQCSATEGKSLGMVQG